MDIKMDTRENEGSAEKENLTETQYDFDDILGKIGPFGTYQRRIYFLLAFPCMTSGAFVLLVYNVLATPAHRCKIPFYDNDTYGIQSTEHERLINLTIPSSKDPTLLYDRCNIYDSNRTENNSYRHENAMLVKCNEWVYDTSVFINTYVSDNNLVCGDSLKASHIQMIYFFGVFVGAFCLGSISDRIGRKKTICIGVTLSFLLGMVVPFTSGVYMYGAVQFLLASVSHGFFLCIAVFVMELVGPSMRMWTGMLIQAFFAVGVCYVCLMASLFRAWRWVSLSVAAPSVLFISYWWLIPESPRWLISNHRREEALVVIGRIAKVNKKHCSYTAGQLADVSTGKDVGKIWHLVKSPVLLKRLLLLAINWMVVSMTYFGVTINSGNMGGDYYINFFLMGVIEIPGVLMGVLVLRRFGRRPSMATFMILSGLACVATIPTAVIGTVDLEPLVITLAVIGKCLSSAAFSIVYVYTIELLPTVVRNASLGTCSCSARIGAMVAPYIAKTGELIGGTFGMVEPLLVFGALSVIAGLLILPLPETQNQKLPDTIQEGEQFGNIRKEDEARALAELPLKSSVTDTKINS